MYDSLAGPHVDARGTECEPRTRSAAYLKYDKKGLLTSLFSSVAEMQCAAVSRSRNGSLAQCLID